MIRELLDDRPGVVIVGDAIEADLAGAVRQTRPSVVIMAADSAGLPSAATALLDECALRVLAITKRGDAGILAELVPRRVELDELSGEALLHVLEGAAA